MGWRLRVQTFNYVVPRKAIGRGGKARGLLGCARIALAGGQASPRGGERQHRTLAATAAHGHAERGQGTEPKQRVYLCIYICIYIYTIYVL